jgi:hypothetical protein
VEEEEYEEDLFVNEGEGQSYGRQSEDQLTNTRELTVTNGNNPKNGCGDKIEGQSWARQQSRVYILLSDSSSKGSSSKASW